MQKFITILLLHKNYIYVSWSCKKTQSSKHFSRRRSGGGGAGLLSGRYLTWVSMTSKSLTSYPAPANSIAQLRPIRPLVGGTGVRDQLRLSHYTIIHITFHVTSVKHVWNRGTKQAGEKEVDGRRTTCRCEKCVKVTGISPELATRCIQIWIAFRVI